MANLISEVPEIETPDWEIYYRPLLNDPTISALPFSIAIGQMPRDIFFDGELSSIASAKTTCGWTWNGGPAFTKKTLSPVEIQAAISQCYSVVFKKLFGDKLPTGARRGELSPEILSYMTRKQSNTFNRDLLKVLFLGDDALTNNPYKIKDGIYTSLKAGAAAVDGTVDAGALTATSLNPTNFYATMIAVWDARTREMKELEKSQLTWIWNEKVYEAYIKYLAVATQNTAGIIQTQFIVDGMSPTLFNGVKIVHPLFIDSALEADFLTGSPAVVDDPYRVILTLGNNHIVMLDDEGGFNKLDPFYDRLTDMVYSPASILFDYKYGYGFYNVFAGF